MKSVEVYTKDRCPYCTAAKNLLNDRNIEFIETNVEGDDDKRQWLSRVTGQRTLPQVFIGDEPIGGYVELHALDQAAKLEKMVRS